jgi:integrase
MRDHLLSDITPGTVRAWQAELIAGGNAATMTAKAYRLLRAVLNTAVDATERPIATVAQVFDLAGLVPGRFRVLVLLAAFTSLRYGELAALRRRDLDSRATTLTVRASLVERQDGSVTFGPPKSDAGLRTVTIPTAICRDVRAHLRDFVPDEPDALVFTGAKGVPCCVGPTSSGPATGRPLSPRSAYPASTSTTCGTPGTPSHHVPARALPT